MMDIYAKLTMLVPKLDMLLIAVVAVFTRKEAFWLKAGVGKCSERHISRASTSIAASCASQCLQLLLYH